MAHPLLERLSRGLILSDGAMGTMLYDRGVSFEHCFEELNRSNPSLVQDIHLAYIRAGSELIETNTFGANRVRLASYGMEAKVGEFTLWGGKTAKYARDISGEPVIIAGAIGPLGKPLRPVGKITREEARAIFREAAEGLLEGGVDCFMIETAYDLTEATEAILAIQEITDLPIIAQMTFSEDGKTTRGHTVEDVVEGLSALDVAVIGANCSVGPQALLDVVRQMREVTDRPLGVHPNAGLPRIIQDRYIYLSSPAYMAEYAVAFAEAGAQIIGGCCGTTPDHIAAMREALVKLRPPVELVAAAHRETIEVSGEEEVVAPPSEARSHLAGLLEEDHFVVSVEVGGHTVEDVVEGLSALDVAVIGANCSVGPQALLDVVRQMREVTDRPLGVHPNAGLPRIIQDRYIYLSSPAYMAEYAVAFAEAGAQIIGGCCGTTPDHIAAMREALVKLRPPVELVAAAHRETIEVSGEEEVVAPPSEARSHLAGLLEEDHFVVSVEVDPPKGTNPRKDIEGAAMLKAAGADLINVADSPMARVRMGCMAMAYLIQREVGIETIIHFTTRDRNLMGLQSDLLGAHAVGIRNILALTGDPPRIGDCQDATPVFDVDSVGLIHILRSLNEGKDLSDNSIGEPARFFIICAVNPADPDLDAEMGRFRKKIEAGAELAMTQPLYEIPTLLRFLERCEKIGLNIPILLGVLPLMSFRHASFLHNEVPGIEIPEVMRKRLQDAGDKARQAGVELATELLLEAVPLVKGTYLMPSFGRYEVVADIVKELRRS